MNRNRQEENRQEENRQEDLNHQQLEEHFLIQLVTPLLNWYKVNKRDLPWRRQILPYPIWISEIMLQQTRVEAVKPYYKRFIETLPKVSDLANCQEETLLKLWEGLGYYNRVKNMQIAARQIEKEWNGIFPSSYEEIIQLKGIGSYTAGAIASISFSLPYPAVDGNVLRVMARVRGDRRDIGKASVKKELESELKNIIPLDFPGAFNQGLMELGATICLPKGLPKCEQCPWNRYCRTNQKGNFHEIPVKEKKMKRRIEERTIIIIQDGEKIYLKKRPDHGLLASLYEFFGVTGYYSVEDVLLMVKDMGFSPLRMTKLPDAKHIFSHVEWQMQGYLVRVDSLEIDSEKIQEGIFAEIEEFVQKYPLPSAFSAYLSFLNIPQGKDHFQDKT